ncbi:TOG array regulator of axonemal microtubules protein 2 isoform X4 [Columba livia]|uniref:TOG array regulator of axonemal microtubules protein 2 isoform X4 n=1 Tax=Columba livia TaxID=8932 RepID=UPI0031BB8ADB
MPVNESSAEQALPLHSSTCHAVPQLRSLSDVGSDGSWETWCFLSGTLWTRQYQESVAVTCTSSVIFPRRLLMLQGNPPAAVPGPPTSSTSSRLSSAKNPSLPPTMAMQDDFTAAKYHTSIAVYCRSVPQFKPRHKALRGGSIDSNLQFRGSSWTTEEGASFQSILTIKMKKQLRFLNEDGDGDGRKPNAIPPLDDWASEADVQDFSTGQGGDHPHLSHQALTQDPQEREASSADSGTIQIKDKLKTKRMSEGLSASYREVQTLEPILPALQHRVAHDVKSARRLREPVAPLPSLPTRQAKETSHRVRPRLLSVDDFKISNEKIRVVLCKSAQEKIDQQQMRERKIVLREREKETEKSLWLPALNVDPRDEANKSFGPPPVSGTVPSMSNTCKESAGTALRKRFNRPSLPSVPVINKDSRVPRKSSVNSLPPIALDSSKAGDEPECRDAQEAKPDPNPQQALLNALTWLSSDDWEEKVKGLISIRCLAISHSEVLLSRLHDVSLVVIKEVNNLRSKVCCCAINTLGVLFGTMKKDMDHEVDEIARVLLWKMGDSSDFIQTAANQSLGLMVGSVTPARAMAALMASGVQHRNVLVRKTAAEHLLTAMERIGAKKLLSGIPTSTEVLVCMLVNLALDCHQNTRCYGRKMLNLLMNHPKFDSYLKKSVPSRDLEAVMAMIKQKGTEGHQCEPPSAKEHKKSKKNGLMMPQDNLPSNGGSVSDVPMPPSQTARQKARQTVRQTARRPSQEETEQRQELCKLLTAEDFQTRMEGVMLLLDHCKNNPQLISTNISQIFDVFVLRLQDCNKKVNQRALEALASMTAILGDALYPVLTSLVVAVTENLNSKHLGIYAAAVNVLKACIDHLDNTLLLQILASRVHYLSGKALLDVIECLSVLVATVYPRKPQTVHRHVLPALWFFLGNKALPVRSGGVRAVLTKLAKSLDEVMGPGLKEYATSQPQHVTRSLWDLLNLVKA